MNKNLYRIIFNARRGIRMAVAETACAQGKSASGETSGATNGIAGSMGFTFRPLALSIALLGLGPWALAQIVVDRNAPGNQQPTLMQTANGLPQVNIQTPSAAGVSRNVYTQFDVQSQGVILNNSTGNVQTQLGGFVQGNPWLTAGSARVILNEINSNNPSQIRGYVEVAGQRAEVIIANPAGIAVSGGGFINASAVTLTTGAPVMNGGNLESFRVRGGSISISGTGLDTGTADYTNILARAVQVNAGIWAKDLKVVTGANTIDASSASNPQVQGSETPSGTAPAFAIDVAQLGGMYAGKIFLVGTEAGLGVRNAGTLGATAGNLTIDNNGWLSNSGTVHASGNTRITTKGDIANTGSGFIAAQGNTTLDAQSAGSQITQDATASLMAGVDRQGNVGNGAGNSGNLQATATGAMALQGQIASGGDTTLSAAQMDLSRATLSARDASLTASTGDINATQATVSASGTLSTNAAQTLRTNGATVSAAHLVLQAHDISNVSGQLQQTGTADMTVALAGNLDNTDGTIASNAANLSLSANTLTNLRGQILHAGTGTLQVQATDLQGSSGKLLSNGALDLSAAQMNLRSATLSAQNVSLATSGGDIDATQATVSASGTFSTNAAQTLRTDSATVSAAHLVLQAHDISNVAGQLQQTGTADMTVALAGNLDNTDGTIASNATNLSLSANTLTNLRGQILHAGSGTLQATATDLQGTSGKLLSNGSIDLTAAQMNLRSATVGAHDVSLTSRTGDINATQATVSASGTLSTNAAQTLRTDSATVSAAHLALQAHDLSNVGGQLQQTGTADMTVALAGNLDNTDGTMASNAANLALSATTLINLRGQVLHAGTGTLDVQATDLQGSSGKLLSNGALNLAATNATVDQGTTAAATVTITATRLSNQSGLIVGSNALSITADTLDNTSGRLHSDADLTVKAAQTITNTDGLITAGQLTIRDTAATPAARALAVTNTRGTMLASQKLQVSAGSLDSSGNLLSQGDMALDVQGNLNNSGSMLASNNATVAVGGTLTHSGTLQAGNTVDVMAQNLDAAATAEISGATTQLKVAGTLTNQGLIDSSTAAGTGETRIDAGTLRNTGAGRIYGDTVSIAATTLTNDAQTTSGVTTAATIAARTQLDIGATTLDNLQGASILSLGDMTIGGTLDASRRASGAATTVTNSASTIEAQGALTIRSGAINNLNPNLTWTKDAGMQGGSGTLYYTDGGTFDSANGAVLASADPLVGMSHGGYTFQHTDYEAEVSCSYGKESEICRPTGNIIPVYSYSRGAAQAAPGSSAYTLNGFSTYTQTDYQAIVTKSTPGRIASGGDMNLQVTGKLLNDQSEIVAGGALNIVAGSVDNNARTIQLDSVRNGTSYVWWQYDEGCGNPKGCDYNYQAYRPSDYSSTVAKTQVLDIHVTRDHANGAVASRSVASASTQTVGSASGPAGQSVGNVSAGALSQTVGTTAGPTTTSVSNASAASAHYSVPTSSLYRINTNPSAHYLVATDPRFTNYKTWLSSDYITAQIAMDPTVTQKRLGDGYYEQRLINEQVSELTGKRFLGNYSNDQQQYQALMDAGITYAQNYNLREGVALTAAQIAVLTSDIVWLQQETVTLADGSTQQALVPHLYLAPRAGDLAPNGQLFAGATLSGNTVNIQTSGDTTNSGSILGRQLVQISADNIANLNGMIRGQNVAMDAAQDITNTGGSVIAQDSLIAQAGRNITVASTTGEGSGGGGNYTHTETSIDRVAGLYVTGSNGTLLASAGNDLSIIAGQVSSKGDATLAAGNNLNLSTVKTSQTNNFGEGSTDHHLLTSQSQDVGSTIQAGGNITLAAGNDLNAKATNVQATGDLNASAGNQVNITAGQQNSSYDYATKSTSSGFLSSTTTVQRDTATSQNAIGSNLGGANVNISSGQDTLIKGSNVVADQNLTINAGGNVTIAADQNSQTSSHFYSKSESGLLSGGGMGISIGEREQSQANKITSTTAAASTVGSVGGDVSITSGKAYTQTGSDVVAPAGNIAITAQQIQIQEARETTTSQTEQKFSQSGLTLSVSSPVISAAQTIQNMAQAAGHTNSGRMQALAGASAALAGYSAYTAIDNGQGSTINGKAGQIAGTDKDGNPTVRDATASDKAGGINVNISLGSSTSESTTVSTGNTARGSTLVAKGDVDIRATGASTDSNVLIQGSSVQAGNVVNIQADNAVQLLAAVNTATQTSTNSSSSGSVGIGFGTNGLTVNVSASQGQGHGDGSDISYANTQVQAGNKVILQSGGDTALKGAVVSADTVVANVGGDLNIESLQDKSTYKETQSSSGLSISVPIGAGKAGVSINASQTDINSNYQSANQQSGIQAGDGGFQITVQGNTDLKGGLIAGSAQAIADNKNSLTTATLTTSDLQNQSSASVNTSGFSMGTDMLEQGKYGLAKAVLSNGLNNDTSQSGSSSGQTLSAISAGIVTITNDAAQTQLTGKNAAQTVASLNRDTKNTNTVAQRQDVQAMKDKVAAEQAIKTEAFKQLTTFTDEAWKTMYKNGGQVYRVPPGCKDSSCAIPLSKEEAQNLQNSQDGMLHLSNNGIFNDLDGAVKYAQQHGGTINADGTKDYSDKPENQYIIFAPEANNTLSELMVAFMQKSNLTPYLGLTTSEETTAAIVNNATQQGQTIVIDSHSRGSLTTTNAEQALLNQGGITVGDNNQITPNIKMYSYGAAQNNNSANQVLKDLTGNDNAQVNSTVHPNDYIGAIVGWNLATPTYNSTDAEGRNQTVTSLSDGRGVLSNAYNIAKGTATPHNCYGSSGDVAGCNKQWDGNVVITPKPPKSTQVQLPNDVQKKLNVGK